MRIGVLGAGLSGCTIALELADAGHQVVLIDRQAEPLLGASSNCEGKLHLGYVYGLDDSLRTAETMLQGAGHFRPLLERWVGADCFETGRSSPFIYAIPHDSMLPANRVLEHFRQVSARLGANGLTTQWREYSCLTESKLAAVFDPDRIALAVRTHEFAIDPLCLRERLLAALDEMPSLSLLMAATVCDIVALPGERFRVGLDFAGERNSEDFDCVVNCLWEQRLALDARLGHQLNRPVIHRFKSALRTQNPDVFETLPSVTFTIGEYGDTVAYPGRAYASWYPTGLLSEEVALAPSRTGLPQDEEAIEALKRSQLEALAALMPGAAEALDWRLPGWSLCGGYITAWGQSGIADSQSELHQRTRVGVHSYGRYHSVDTGKLTLAPLIAKQACDRILGR
ncbi:FAD-dependent oxidoreductase [Maricaulis parjimensis]|uniref:FAD-dependent oxidoreductase n=1 Tax=Maricaulis parjimensis TaxID=144023 RepID=UPI00193AAED1